MFPYWSQLGVRTAEFGVNLRVSIRTARPEFRGLLGETPAGAVTVVLLTYNSVKGVNTVCLVRAVFLPVQT